MAQDRTAGPSGVPGTAEDLARWVERLGEQSRSAAALGSVLQSTLLAGIAEDLGAGGPCAQVLRTHLHEPNTHALGLRFTAAVHRLVLRRRAPALAMHYASVGGEADPRRAWPAFLATVEEHAEVLAELTRLPCQTNEVGRSAALAPAILWAAQQTQMRRIVHLELGSSAGLNLRWDAFRYASADGAVTWGDPDSPVDLTGHWLTVPGSLPREIEVIGRHGCDPRPGDPTTPDTREGLTASVWPDQRARHARLKGALQLAEQIPATVDQMGAAAWLRTRSLTESDTLTVVSHSVVWRYIDPRERLQIRSILADLGASSASDRPLAWIRLEPGYPTMTYDGSPYPVAVTIWPGEHHTVTASAQAHGQEVRWTS